MSFFRNLNFSSSNEDGASELTALAPARRILCLTGSGTRPLDLLMSGADEVIALDLNPAQNALLALKIAAIDGLDHADLLAFLGITPSADRLALYKRIRPGLTTPLQGHWDARARDLRNGIWYAGKWERLLWWNAQAIRLLRGRNIDALMDARSVEEQATLWQAHFSGGRLQKMIEMIGRKWIWHWVIREPAGQYLPAPRAVGARLAEGFDRAAENFLFRDSDFATLILKGRLNPAAALPVHLHPENFDRLRAGLPRLRLVEGGLTDLTALDIAQVDGFSLSDFGSYTDTAAYAACWSGIRAAAAPGAAFCERIFMNDLDLPFDDLKEDEALSQQLTRTDRAIIYRLRAGRIGSSA